MTIYLYLEKEEYAKTWVDGGKAPICLASKYLHDKRDGTKTIDETKIREGIPLSNYEQYGMFFGNMENYEISGNTYNGEKMPDAKGYREDGLILSFCNDLSSDIARKLRKVICVEIIDIEKTKQEIDRQLGVVGVMRNCEYTTGHERNPFLKSVEDSWQNELRIYWKNQLHSQEVIIPSGTAKIVWP